MKLGSPLVRSLVVLFGGTAVLALLWAEGGLRRAEAYLAVIACAIALFDLANVIPKRRSRPEHQPVVQGRQVFRQVLHWGAVVVAIGLLPWVAIDFLGFSIDAGWIGLALPIAVLIPVVAITLVMGWHRDLWHRFGWRGGAE